jgi:hypothetical protein
VTRGDIIIRIFSLFFFVKIQKKKSALEINTCETFEKSKEKKRSATTTQEEDEKKKGTRVVITDRRWYRRSIVDRRCERGRCF